MKKVIALLLVGAVMGGILFADDASTLPARVGRLSLAGVYGFTTGAFDSDWKRQDPGSDIHMIHLGLALEYGITDWITGALQWAPGGNVWSKFEGNENQKINGLYDIFLGAMFQIVGKKAPVKNEMLRFSLAPGVKIPLPGPDFEKNYNKMVENMTPPGANNKYNAASLDNHVFGFGFRGYFDIVFNENFFLNFYTNFVYYPVKGKLEKQGLAGYGAAQALKGAGQGTQIVNYGYDLDFEIEPRYILPLDKMVLNFCLPFTYVISPGVEYETNAITQAILPVAGITDGVYSHIFSMRPGISMMLTKTPLPLEFKLEYSLPLIGKNTTASNAVILAVKAYFKI